MPTTTTRTTASNIITAVASAAGATAIIYPYAQDVSTAINSLDTTPTITVINQILFNIVGASMTAAIGSKIFDALNNLTSN